MYKALIFLYELVMLLAAPLLGLAFLLSRRGRYCILQRFGVWQLGPILEPLVWFHAASLGEVRGLRAVIEAYRSRFPDHKILLTSSSDSGLKAAQELSDFARLLPFDSSLFIFFALRRIDISALIISETELWPALISAVKARGIKLALINARISKRTFKRYLALRIIFARLLASFDLILVSGESSRERFRALGVQKLLLVANSKYQSRSHVQSHYLSKEQRHAERAALFKLDKPVLILGSLRPGEEQGWFDFIKSTDSLNLIVAARHLEKLNYFEKALDQRGLHYSRLSTGKAGSIVIVDSYGKLESLYQLSDLAFVGGTLKDYGGHTPLEAAQAGCALLIGPYQDNIEDIVSILLKADAAMLLQDSKAIESVLNRILEQPEKIQALGERARMVSAQFDRLGSEIVEQIEKVIQER